jgi:hypothetical protein
MARNIANPTEAEKLLTIPAAIMAVVLGVRVIACINISAARLLRRTGLTLSGGANMNYIKIQNNYINLDQVSYFKTDSIDYCITFYCRNDYVLAVDFDYRHEFNEALDRLEMTIKEKGSLVK